jgi:hypothetical protein
MCSGLDTSALIAVASFFLAVSLKDEISCCPVTITMVVLMEVKNREHTEKPQLNASEEECSFQGKGLNI